MKKKFLFIIFIILFMFMTLSSQCFAEIKPNSFVYNGTVYTIPEDTCQNYSYFMIYYNEGSFNCYRFFVSDSPIILDYENGKILGQDITFTLGSTITETISKPITREKTGEQNSVSAGGMEEYVFLYSNVDLLDSNGDLVFQEPPQSSLAPIVEGVETEKTLEEVVLILPIILLTLVGLIGLRKALRMLSMVLRQS